MIGGNYSKKLRLLLKGRRSGQVLLIVIMLIAVVLTVVLTVTFTSRTETQLTKLEEENQKALAAAEAGIEAALKAGASIADFSGLNVPEGFSGSATVTPATGTEFVSPFLPAGQQYTFYLSDYPGYANPFTGALRVHYGTASGQDCNAIALEITIVSGTASPYTFTRYIADTGNKLTSNQNDVGVAGSPIVAGQDFSCRTSNITPPANSRFMLVRTISAGTKVGFSSQGNPAPSFNSQGKYIDSEAESPTGVTKIVQLFQSNPQIPADFFVTSF